ncbi:MAG: AGE family epimerase/isomerase, partial [Proteobacteria bacterium]|nr:AGE family epimerase/isomerase [Pseudomonadota bacterium]
MSFLNQYFEDNEKGGLFHKVSEDFSTVLDTSKHVEDQFIAARSHVMGAMISHDPETIADAEKVVVEVIKRFEDTKHGGYFLTADKDWKIIDNHKNLLEAESIFGILMHLYEVSKKDEYLLKGLDFLDLLLDRAWDKKHGGFFSLYHDNWAYATDSKDLVTQCGMLQHMGGAWKDGIDSP